MGSCWLILEEKKISQVFKKNLKDRWLKYVATK